METTLSQYWHLDVVTQILIRLPVSSIIKCMCVCKQWHCLVTSDEFISIHLSYRINRLSRNILVGHRVRSSSNHLFTLFCDSENTSLLQTIPSPFNSKKDVYQHLRIIGSIHGLICLGISERNSNSIIWNPLLKRYLEIPDSHINFSMESCFNYAVMGFGFDSIRNDYKVVRMVFIERPYGGSCQRVAVYSLKEHSWRELDADEVRPCVIVCWTWSSCFTNGTIHWIAKEQTDNHWRTFILSFNVNDESFCRIELPKDLIIASYWDLHISKTEGLLSVFHYKKEEASTHPDCFKFCDIWVKKEYNMGNLWTKICNIEFEDKLVARVLEVRENGTILMAKKLHENQFEDELAFYDPKTKETKTFGVQLNSSLFYAGAYGESLLLLDKVTEAIRTEGRIQAGSA